MGVHTQTLGTNLPVGKSAVSLGGAYLSLGFLTCKMGWWEEEIQLKRL